MEDNLGRVIGGILAVVLLIIIPLTYTLKMVETKKQNYIDDVAYNFVDNICNDGYIDKGMYDQLIKKLCYTGDSFKIKIIHKKDVYFPINSENPFYTTQKPYVIAKDCYGESQILETIYDKKKQYKLEIGDKISVIVERKNMSSYSVMRNILLGIAHNDRLTANYSGDVQYERY